MPEQKHDKGPKPPVVKIDKTKVKSWIQDEFTGDTIVFAKEFGTELVKNRLTTSQIRNIFGEVKRLAGQLRQNDNALNNLKKDFLMLRPKLAYAAKRAGTRGIESLRDVLETAHIAVTECWEKGSDKETQKAFENFVDFFEAILAYHKAEGGRE